jgi:hypothetical protein
MLSNFCILSLRLFSVCFVSWWLHPISSHLPFFVLYFPQNMLHSLETIVRSVWAETVYTFWYFLYPSCYVLRTDFRIFFHPFFRSCFIYSFLSYISFLAFFQTVYKRIFLQFLCLICLLYLLSFKISPLSFFLLYFYSFVSFLKFIGSALNVDTSTVVTSYILKRVHLSPSIFKNSWTFEIPKVFQVFQEWFLPNAYVSEEN